MNALAIQVPIEIENRNQITSRVKEMIIRQLNLNLELNQLDNDSPLFGLGLGLDSVDALELIVGVEQEFGKMIQADQKSIFQSVNTIVDFVMRNPE